MPSSPSVHVTKGSSLTTPSGGQTQGMIRMNAITNLSDQLCGTGKKTLICAFFILILFYITLIVLLSLLIFSSFLHWTFIP